MLNSTVLNSNDPEPPRKKVTGRQAAANRANAQKSSGPQSPEGKARSRFNSLKHGLTAHQVCLPGESREEYDQRRLEYFQDLRPATLLEADILDDYIAARWRKDRIIRHEKCLLLENFMQRRANISEQYESITLDVEAALAFQDLGDRSTVLKNLDRYETRIVRNIQVAYNQLMELSSNRPPVPSDDAPLAPEENGTLPNEPIPTNEHPEQPEPAPITNATGTVVIPRKQPQPAPKTMAAGLTTHNSQPTTHNSQLTTHNSQPITHNSQPTTHNPQLLTPNS